MKTTIQAAFKAEGRMKGTPKSPETRAKMAASRKLYWERKHHANSR